MPALISIIVPCYNEEATIGLLLDAVFAQSYPRPQMEVVIVDGLSQDNTRDVISAFHNDHPELALRVINNHQRTIPSSLNQAISAARGDIIIRLDAHSIPIPDYVKQCVQAIEQGKGKNVGGTWVIRPGGPGPIAEGIAAAASHPLGVGDAMYRIGTSGGPVDTVPFGAFRRDLIAQIGGFDETLLANEDYEFNTRIRKSGGIVWLDPNIRSTYITRPSLQELAKQYWRYGFWKFRMLRRYPNTLRWRQALPPVFVASLLCLIAGSVFSALARIVLFFEIISYLLVLAGAGLHLAFRRRKPLLMPSLVLAIAAMHVSWGSGFLWSFVSTSSKHHG